MSSYTKYPYTQISKYYPVDSSMLLNEFQDILGNYNLNITNLPDYGPIMNYIEKFQSKSEFEHLNDTSIDFESINNKLSNSTTQIRDMKTYNELISKIINNYRYKCLARCEINDISVLDFISAGVGGSTYKVNFVHKTIKYYSLNPSFINNSKGSIPIVFKIIDDDSTKSNYKCEILHEAAIGIALNSISHMTPNFMYFYGLLPSDFNYNIQVPENSIIAYNTEYPGFPVFEYINGQTLEKWLSARVGIAKEKQNIKSVISQVLLSLYIANEMLDYTHFDLHLGNVMVIDLGTQKPIQYELPDGIIYEWNTRYLVKIIDYGRNYAKIKNMKIIKDLRGFEKYGIDNQPNHQFDIVRFLLYTLHITQDTEIYDTYLQNFITGPLSFNDLDNIIAEYVKFYNTLPVEQRKLDISLTGLDIVQKIMGSDIVESGEGIDYDDSIFDEFIMKTKYHTMITLCPSTYDLLNKQKRRVMNLLNELKRYPNDLQLKYRINKEFSELYNIIDSHKTYHESYYNYLVSIYKSI